MAESAISFLFNQLAIWLREEQNLLGGLRQEVEFIQGDLGQMRTFLRVADSKEESDPQLKEWVSQVREIAYDTEDVLDRYMLQFARRGAHGFRGCLKRVYSSMRNLKAQHQIACDIKKIRSRVENASKSYQTYRDKYPIMLSGSTSNSNLSRNTSYDGRGDALLLEEKDVVGIEGPKEQLLEWLASTDYGLTVISVVGMAGLGKTTLVKKVYDYPSIEKDFDVRAWVTVSESFKVEYLLEEIIKQLEKEVKQPLPPGLETMNNNDKREFIYNFLQNKNYIIVLDDVWRTDAWEEVRYAFPRSTTHGRGCIMITSRFSSIGNAACSETNGHVYKLEPLSKQDSKELFCKKAFQGNSIPPHLKEISERILERCEGWPLAIVVIGGLLATKGNQIDEWEMLSRSLGPELQGDNFKRMRKLLSLSFYDLPYYLKACFLYLGVFPEDEEMERGTVIRLWTAEGFVEAKQGKTMQEIADGYLNELLNRSLIQAAQATHGGRSTYFRMHDLVREYIISKASEQNIAVVDNGGEILQLDRIRRLALRNSINPIHQINKFGYLRSLLFFGPIDPDWGPMLNRVFCSGSRMLKVLNLRGASMGTIPNEIFKLYHLKYLSLRNTQVEFIPKSIGNLRKLETLDLKGSRVTKLPIEILKLERLENLLVYNWKDIVGYYPIDGIQGFNAPYEIGRLFCLQKLCYIEADIEIVREIEKLTRLQRLAIVKLKRENGKELCSSLTKLTMLRSLSITSFEEDEVMDLEHSFSPSNFPFLRKLVLRGCLEKIPQWIPRLNSLTVIQLRWSRLREDPLEHLQGLPNLQVLDMECAYEGEQLVFKAGCFQSLKNLYLYRLRGLRCMTVEKGSMPLLQHLELWGSKLMVEMPLGIEHLTNLRYLYFTDMAEEFVERLVDEKRKQGDEWKLAHIGVVMIAKYGEWELTQL